MTTLDHHHHQPNQKPNVIVTSSMLKLRSNYKCRVSFNFFSQNKYFFFVIDEFTANSKMSLLSLSLSDIGDVFEGKKTLLPNICFGFRS